MAQTEQKRKMEQQVREVKIRGKELNGIGLTLKQIIDKNIENPSVWKSLRRLKGSLVIKEAGSGTLVSLFFDSGRIWIQNKAMDKPSAYVEAGFVELADMSSGRVGPIRSLVSGRIRARGNLVKLLRMSKVLISQEDK